MANTLTVDAPVARQVETKPKATKTKAHKAKVAKKPKAPKKAKRLTEDVLLKRYPQMVKGSLHYSDAEQRNICKVGCAEKGCKKTREVATSDLFQVKRCLEHTKTCRNLKRKKNK